MNSVTCESLLL